MSDQERNTQAGGREQGGSADERGGGDPLTDVVARESPDCHSGKEDRDATGSEGVATAKIVQVDGGPDGRSGPADSMRQRGARSHVIRQRLAGYRDELTAAGIDWADVPVVECGPYSREAGYRAAGTLLDGPSRPTALLAASDELALGALRAAAERGIAVPEQLSVVGFDDAPTAAWATSGLTTVRQPHYDKGRVAAEQLLKPAGREETILPIELVVRGSTLTAHQASAAIVDGEL
jgi:hypothetical protein